MEAPLAIVLKYKGEKSFVSIDHSAGGYPHPVMNMWHAYHWASEEDALKYAKMFKTDIIQKTFKLQVSEVK